MEYCKREDAKEYKSNMAIIEKAKAYIDLYYLERLTRDDVSSMFFIDKYYFSKCFKKIVGVSFMDYIVLKKIEHSKYLLLTFNMKISEVAYILGYEDLRAFRRIFKKITGIPPQEYKRKNHIKPFE